MRNLRRHQSQTHAQIIAVLGLWVNTLLGVMFGGVAIPSGVTVILSRVTVILSKAEGSNRTHPVCTRERKPSKLGAGLRIPDHYH
jgi:hypothetical protein